MYQILHRLLAAALAADAPQENLASAAASATTTLTGIVTLADSGLACDHFSIFLRQRDSLQVLAVGGESGRFHCAIQPGSWDLAIVAPGHDVLEHRVTIKPGHDNTLGVVRLRPGSGRLVVEVLNAEHEPLADQRVLLVRVGPPTIDDTESEASVRTPQPIDATLLDEDVVSQRTDESGRACFSSVPSGPLALTVTGDAVLWVPERVVLCEGEDRLVRLARPVSNDLAINLTDAAGERILIDTIRLERRDAFRMHATCAANFCCRSLGEDTCELAGLVAFPRLASLYHVWVAAPAGTNPVVLGSVPTGEWSITIQADGRTVTRQIVMSTQGARLDVELPQSTETVAVVSH